MADLDDFFSKKDKKKSKKKSKAAKAHKAAADESASNPVATFRTTCGEFRVELLLQRAPLTVSNFVDLANRGFYDGLAFHRVIADFMLQFGCPNTREAATWPQAGKGNAPPGSAFTHLLTGARHERSGTGCIDDEFLSQDSNAPMTLSMANTGAPDSGGSQFFINVASNTALDWFEHDHPASRHVVFGRLLPGGEGDKGGEAVVMALARERTNANDRPARLLRVMQVSIGQGQATAPAAAAAAGPEAAA